MQTVARKLWQRGRAWVPLALLAAAVGCAPVTQPTAPAPAGDGLKSKGAAVGAAGDGKRRHALLVGVATYDDPTGTFPNLAYPEADVDELAAALKTGGYRADDVLVMTVSAGARNPRLLPTADNVRARLGEVLAKCGADDVLLVGFTGHGIEQPAGQPQFCAYRCRPDAPDTLVNLARVQEQMAGSAAGTKVLVSDACRVAGTKAPAGPRKVADSTLPSVTARPNTAMITYFSCNPGEFSWESDELKHGLFFAHLIKALGGDAAVHGDGQVTWSEVAGYVDRRIAAHNAKNPNRKQNPHFKGDVSRAAPLAVRAPAPAPPPTTPAPAGGPPDAAGAAVEKTFTLNMPIVTNVARVEVLLERIEVLGNNRMRWHYSFFNKSGKDVNYNISHDGTSNVTDDQGRACKILETSTKNSHFTIPDGQRQTRWIEYQEPFADSKVLTARFPENNWWGDGIMPRFSVRLGGAVGGAGGAGGAGTGTLVLKSGTKIRNDVEVWVEVDGVRAAAWPAGTTELELTVPAGNRRVAVFSTYQKKTNPIYDRTGAVPANERTTILVAK